MFCANHFCNAAFILSFAVIALIYLYVKHLYSYWERRGVPQLHPSFPFGNFGENVLQKLCPAGQIDAIYRATTEPFIGVYTFLRPTFFVRDPNLVRTILVKDFAHFTDRGVYVDEKNDPLSAHLFALEGDKWKNLRTKLTPTFTSGKMKSIFVTLLDGKRPLLQHIENLLANGDETIETRDLTACYTTNVIASVAFGIDTNCFGDKENPFRKYGRKPFEINLKNSFRNFCFGVCPKLIKWTGIRATNRDVDEFFFDMVKQTLKLREEQNIVRKDFFQLLVQLRNSGTVEIDDEWRTVIANNNSKSLTLEQITAQAFIFYLAGFETSSSTMSFCLYEIAKDPDMQQRVQAEIDKVLAQNNGQLTYDSLGELHYLECCIDETLRKYSVLPTLNRVCTKEYKVPGTNVTLEKGTSVFIPVFSLQRDEKYYSDPEKFDPTRFFNENKSGKTFNEMPYLPFGDGPRNCIGMRMGRMSTTVGLATILENYVVSLGHQHIGQQMQFSKNTFVLTPAAGINLKFTRRHLKTEL